MLVNATKINQKKLSLQNQSNQKNKRSSQIPPSQKYFNYETRMSAAYFVPRSGPFSLIPKIFYVLKEGQRFYFSRSFNVNKRVLNADNSHVSQWDSLTQKPYNVLAKTKNRVLAGLEMYINAAKAVEKNAHWGRQLLLHYSGSYAAHAIESFSELNRTFRLDRVSTVFVTHAQATKVYLKHVGAKMDIIRNPAVGKGMGIMQSIGSTLALENLISYLTINVGLSNGTAAACAAMIVTGGIHPLSKIKTEFISNNELHSLNRVAGMNKRMEIVAGLDKSIIFRGAQFVMLRNVLFSYTNEVMIMSSLRTISKLLNQENDSTAIKSLAILFSGPVAGLASLSSKSVSYISDLAVKNQDKSFQEIFKIIENQAPSYSNTVKIGRILGAMVGQEKAVVSLFKVMAASNSGFFLTARLMATLSFCRFLLMDKEMLFKMVRNDMDFED